MSDTPETPEPELPEEPEPDTEEEAEPDEEQVDAEVTPDPIAVTTTTEGEDD